nr:hypothetical protein [Tanacetum cinerariifolium]
VDIEEDENKSELTYPYEEVNPLNPLSPASKSKPKDVIKVKDMVGSEDETVPASVHEVCESSTAPFLQEDSGGLLHGKAKDEYYGKLILDLGNEVRSSIEEGTTVMENLVRKLGNDEEKAECRKLKEDLEEARSSNILLRMQNEQAVVCRMIKESVDAAIATERARHANAGNDARGSGPVRGAVELRRWFEKTESVIGINECVEGKKVKCVAATLERPALTW